MDTKKLRDLADDTFGKRTSLLSLWQEQAENFYPERADFTFKRYLGDDFAGNLTTSYPLLVRRDLGDQLGQMLRPSATEWFHMVVTDQRRENSESKTWLQWATGLQRRAMYDPDTMWTRAAKEADHDFATFGQTVLTVRLNRNRTHMLYQTWHLRDVAWMENEEGKINAIFRRWKPQARVLKSLFKNNHPNLIQKAEKTPFEEVECLHIMVEADMWDGDAKGKPWVSIYYDMTHNHELEAVGVWNKQYVIPRWQTVSGSQYAYSPATVAALPDARLLQAMTYTLLSAGEKIVNPPMVATETAVRSDVALFAGGITWVDYEYDEKLGEALRPLTQDVRGMPVGREMQQDARAILKEAFYLNKLTLPYRAPEMTAYEVAQRVQQYIRDALPIFEPMENDYNGAVCQETFEVLLRAGAFGPPQNMPRILQGAEMQFRYKSPLHEAIDSQKGHKFIEMRQLIAEAIALDKNVAAIPDAVVAVRDALEGIGVPGKWMRSEVQAKQMIDLQKQQDQAQQILATMQQGAEVAATVGAAGADLAKAGGAQGMPGMPAMKAAA